MDVRLPDGTVIQGVPDNISKAELVQRLQRNGMTVPGDWLQQAQQAAPEGSKNNDLASQLGLFVRAGLKGAVALPAMAADAVGGALNATGLPGPIVGAFGGNPNFKFLRTLSAADDLMSRAGVPKPDTPTQRVVSKGVELGMGGGLGAKGADMLSRGATGVSQQVLQRLAANPETQIAAGTGAGFAGQQSAESGGGTGAQFVSSLLGGLTGAGLAGGTKSAAQALAQRNAPAMQPAEIERRIMVALERQGIDPQSITPAMKAALM